VRVVVLDCDEERRQSLARCDVSQCDGRLRAHARRFVILERPLE
jgi:hypothetical protein